jgi:hypothetical protein
MLLASRGGWPHSKGCTHARDHYTAVSGMQEPELFDDQEQEDDDGSFGVLEVLQYVQAAHGPQRDQVGTGRPGGVLVGLAAGRGELPHHRGVSSTVKLSVSKTELLGSNPSAPASILQLVGGNADWVAHLR